MSHDPMNRLLEASKCSSQLELAEFLSVHPSAVTAGKKRKTLPAAWLVTTLKKTGINPDWIMTGSGPRYLVPSSSESHDAAWDYSLQIILTNPPKFLGHLHIRELLAEAYRRCIASETGKGF